MNIYDKYDIDVMRMTMDYVANGGLKREVIAGGGKRLVLPPKADMVYLYNEKNVSILDIAMLFGISKPKVYQLLKEFNLTKDGRNMRKNLEVSLKTKYGTSNPALAGKCNEDICDIIQYLREYNVDGIVFNSIKDKNSIFVEVPETRFIISYHLAEADVPNNFYQQQTEVYENNGKRLIHIWDYEFSNEPDNVFKKIDLIFQPLVCIYGRQTEIRRVETNEKALFLKANHLQGNDRAELSYGLYYESELISLMTFCRPRFNRNYEWELSRFCSLKGKTVIGGGSKLLKRFEEDCKPVNLITYSDYTLFNGSVYVKMGFTNVGLSKPNYKWIKGKEVLTRYQTQKRRLLEKGLTGTSENDIMTTNGFKKVFDCGNKVWVKNYV